MIRWQKGNVKEETSSSCFPVLSQKDLQHRWVKLQSDPLTLSQRAQYSPALVSFHIPRSEGEAADERGASHRETLARDRQTCAGHSHCKAGAVWGGPLAPCGAGVRHAALLVHVSEREGHRRSPARSAVWGGLGPPPRSYWLSARVRLRQPRVYLGKILKDSTPLWKFPTDRFVNYVRKVG